MILQINKNKYIKDNEKTYIVADFDGTLTKGNSKTSWSLIANTNLLPKEYVEERQELFEKYHPIEIDTSLPFEYRLEQMRIWFTKHAELFVKYKLKEEFINKASKDFNFIQFREGAEDFLKFLKDNDIPLIIISAGIGNFIKAFLEYKNCLYDNIYISSNMLKFENGVAVGIENNIIHSLNKNEVSLPDNIKEKLVKRDKVILLGDKIDDIRMVEEAKRDKTIRVGWIHDEKISLEEFKKYYDIICSDDESYDSLTKLLWK